MKYAIRTSYKERGSYGSSCGAGGGSSPILRRLRKITRTARMPRVSPAHGVSARRLAAPETQTWYHD